MKMENVGFVAKGYNLLYANPMPTSGGVDPGFTHHAGMPIFKLRYALGGETPDGRFQNPDFTTIIHEKGCQISFETTQSQSTSEYTETLEQSAEVGLSAKSAIESVKFSASNDYQSTDKTMKASSTMKMASSADCVVYRARMSEFSRKPDMTANFYLGLVSLGSGPDWPEGDLTERSETDPDFELRKSMFFQFFDEFGTHWLPEIQMGSRFGMDSEISMDSFTKLSRSGMVVEASVKATWMSLQEKCPGKSCGSLERTHTRSLERTGAAAADFEMPLVDTENGNFVHGRVARSWLKFPSDLAPEELEELERGSVGLGAGFSKATDAQQTLDTETKKSSMIAIGAAPTKDAAEWAAQTEDENMPVHHIRRTICEMVQLGLARLHGFDVGTRDAPYTPPGMAAPDPQSILYASVAALKPDDKTGDAGTTVAEEHLLHAFNLTAVQSKHMDEDAQWQTVNFCRKLFSSSAYCWHAAKTDSQLTCTPPSDEKVAFQAPDCYDNRDCKDMDGVKRKCFNRVCRFDYERIVEIAVASGNSGPPSCSSIQQGAGAELIYKGAYQDVDVQGRKDNDIKDGCPWIDHTLLCVKKSKDWKKPGVCQARLNPDGDCDVFGPGWKNIGTAGSSDGDINNGIGGPRIQMCVTYEGCEETQGKGECEQGFVALDLKGNLGCNDDVKQTRAGYCACKEGKITFQPYDRAGTFKCNDLCSTGRRKKALTDLAMFTDDSGSCGMTGNLERMPVVPPVKYVMPAYPIGLKEVAFGLNGDLNQGKMCDSVFLCQSKNVPA